MEHEETHFKSPQAEIFLTWNVFHLLHNFCENKIVSFLNLNCIREKGHLTKQNGFETSQLFISRKWSPSVCENVMGMNIFDHKED